MTLNVLELFSAPVQLILSLELNSFFHPVFQVTGRSSISPELGCPPHLAWIPLQCCQWISGWLSVFPLFNSLTPALLPEFISLCSSALLPAWQFQSWSTAHSLYSRWWLVFIIWAWCAQYPICRPGPPCAWGWTCVTECCPIFCEVFTVRVPGLFQGPFQLLCLGNPYSDKQY